MYQSRSVPVVIPCISHAHPRRHSASYPTYRSIDDVQRETDAARAGGSRVRLTLKRHDSQGGAGAPVHRCMSTGCNTSWERKGRGGQTPPDAQEVWHAEHCALDDSWWRGEVQLRAVRDGVTDREPGEADEASEESIVSVFARRMT